MNARRHEPVRLDAPTFLKLATLRHFSALIRRILFSAALVSAVAITAACGSGSDSSAAAGGEVLRIGGIPDQDVARLERMFTLMAGYLEEATGVPVRYVPSNDYAAIVTAFQRGDVQLAWFGGLTGEQARAITPGAEAIVQRPRDAEFHSVFIVGPGVTARSLAELAGLSFTFGSESSTSGHLMPRYFLGEAGIDADREFAGAPGYSGSHDATYRLVEGGAYQAGALNEAVWQSAVAEARVDTSRVRVLFTTPAYFDYNWSIREDVDDRFGDGTRARIERALLELDASLGPEKAELLELFATDRFIATQNSNYAMIRQVAEGLGILR
jgi:phosphonate transport system substrate-binding protein